MSGAGRSGVAVARAGAAARARSSTGFLLGLCLVVASVRAVSVLQPLRNDEGGYLYVARRWHTGGEHLYGDLFVDRPPVLLAIFRVAAATDWDGAIRVLALGWAVALVVAAWHAGTHLAGPAGGRWAAGAGAAVVCSPALAADQAEGELFAAVLVTVCLALALAARDAHDPARRLRLAAAAGLAAGTAPLVKQSALEGVVALAVVTVLVLRRGGEHRRRLLPSVAAAAGGAVLPVAGCVVVGAWAGVDLGTAWHDLVAFRGAAFDVIWSDEPRATVVRAVQLVLLGLVSGVLVAVGAWVAALRVLPRAAPETVTLTVLLAYGLAAVAAGGSYWPTYLLQPAPAVVLAVAVVAPRGGVAARWMRVSVRALATTAALGSVAMAVVYATVPSVWFQQRTGEWLAASAAPGDTAVVTYGHPSILETADLGTPYPLLWSVPMRTLDPEQSRLRATLAGAGAPAWLVEVNHLDSWGIDRGGRLRALVEQRYRVVAEVCGNPVWLRADLDRDLAPPPAC